jgi:NDP-hexose-3-ketoreductase
MHNMAGDPCGDRPIRFGVLGCADIAARRMLPAMLAEPAVELVAVASRDPGRAAEFAATFGGTPVAGYDALLDRDDVDAVYVPVPCGLHGEWVRRSLRSGRHVLVEKPVSAGYHETLGLFALAERSGLVLLENAMFLYHSQHAAVRKLVADGAVGEVREFASAFAIPPKPAGDIRYRPDLGGGALLDVGFYPVRAALSFLGPDLTVAGAVLRYDPGLDVEVSGSALLHDSAGVTAHLTFGMEHDYRTMYQIWGSGGRLTLDRAFTPPDDHRPVLKLDRQNRYEERVLPADTQFGNVLRAFVDRVRTGRPALAEAQESVRHAQLIDQIRSAARRIRMP